MDTITINITLPRQMKQAVDSQVKRGLYTSFSEFVRNAVRHLLFSPVTIPYGPSFSPQAEKQILATEKRTMATRNKNIVLNNPDEIRAFFRNL